MKMTGRPILFIRDWITSSLVSNRAQIKIDFYEWHFDLLLMPPFFPQIKGCESSGFVPTTTTTKPFVLAPVQ